MRCACIDIGSNTTRLLVAELHDGVLREIVAQRVFHRLRGALAPETVAAVAATVAAQAESARAAGAADVCVVGTAAIRSSPSGPGLCAAIRNATGLAVRVLSSEDEARLAFLGATHAIAGEQHGGLVAVVDVGGGSSEIACGTPGGEVVWAVSVPIGSGSLADQHLSGDPPGPEQLDRARAAAAAALAGLAPPQARAAYAVGGSATSLRRLLGPEIDRPALSRAVDTVCALASSDVAREHDLHLERVRVLPAGMILLGEASALLGLPLKIAGGGLREGVIVERLCA